ncbi:hypothetical protein CF319_g3516 [Tilletia indica]|nr:hypothetical protein CF319_g3516 [Tilletia indica]
MSTSSQAPASAEAATAVVAQQAQELSPDPLLPSRPSTAVTTSTPSSSSTFPLLKLPPELIKSVLERCDDSTLLKLRQACRRIKTMIDEDMTLDQFPFRYRPFANPPLTDEECEEIMYGERAHDPLFRGPVGRNTITVNPALQKLRWSAQDGWTEARLGSRLRASDDPESAYSFTEPWLEVDNPGYQPSKLVSRFKIKDFPWVLDETATCPPVWSLEVILAFEVTSKPFVSMVVGRKGTDNGGGGGDVQHQESPQPVLVRDVIGALRDLARRCDHVWPRDDPYRGPEDDRVPLNFDTAPLLQGGRSNTVALVYDHVDMTYLTEALKNVANFARLFFH